MRNRIAIPPEDRLGESRMFLLSPCYVHDVETVWIAHADTWVEASIIDKCKEEMWISPPMLERVPARMRRAA